ncbi:MAG: hypothetical protein ABIE94_01500 [archaeon]
MLIETFSGIRGFEKDLTEESIGKYILSYTLWLKQEVKKPTVVIGMDPRPSSYRIKKTMIKELLAEGCNVLDVDVNPTPAIELAVREFKADGGIIITGSHNDVEYNGWKFLSSNGAILEPEHADWVISNAQKAVVCEKKPLGKAVDKVKEASEKYIEYILGFLDKEAAETIKKRKLKAVVDPNGGAGAVVVKEILGRLGVKVIAKNMKIGGFVRTIEPNVNSLDYLSEVMKQEKADIGAGFDCDADRVEFLDDLGRMMSGQFVAGLLAEEVLPGWESGNKVVVINDATSWLIKEVAAKYDAKVVEVEVGEINVVKGMDKYDSIIGLEGSNGGCMVAPSRCRDGIQTLVFILGLIAKSGKKLSELYDELPKYYTPRINVKRSDIDVVDVKKKIEKTFRNQGYKIQKTGDETGGLKIVIDDTSWIWYRASKTEHGVFRIIVDSKSKEKSEDLLRKGEQVFRIAVGE